MFNNKSSENLSKRERKYIEPSINILNESTPFYISEAFKAARTNLIFSLVSSKNKIITISSACPAEGKSTVALNLAIAMSQTTAKVLLIDADLRKPILHKRLFLSNENGLSSILGGFTFFEDTIHRDVFPSMDVVTSGPIPPTPAELLASDAMKELLEVLQTYYDYIFIDTPPINVVSDALALSPITAGIVLACRENVTTHPEFSKAVASLRFANSKILGTVMTDVGINNKSYSKYNKKYYRNYADYKS